MSETPVGTGQEPGTEGQKTFDADYVAKLRAEAAKYRTEAKANADAAAELASLKEASKTADQKTAETLAAMQAQLDAQKVATTRGNIALKFHLDEADAALLTGTEDEMSALAARLAKDTTKPAPRADNVGKTPAEQKTPDNGLREVAHNLFGNN